MTNPFFTPSALPYRLPPFAEIREEHYIPAFERGTGRAPLAEVGRRRDRDGPPPPSPTRSRRWSVPEGRSSGSPSSSSTRRASDNTPGIQEIQKEITPKLAAHGDSIHLNAALYAGGSRPSRRTCRRGRWLLLRYLTDFVRAGAELDEASKARLREINEETVRPGHRLPAEPADRHQRARGRRRRRGRPRRAERRRDRRPAGDRDPAGSRREVPDHPGPAEPVSPRPPR